MEYNRILSLLCALGGVAPIAFPSILGPASSCSNAGCVGVGAADGITLVFLEFVIFTVAIIFATRSYNRIDGKPSLLRMLELWVIRILMLGLTLMVLSLVLTIAG